MATEPKTVPNVPINESSPLSGRIAWHSENILKRAIKAIFNVIANPLVLVVSYGLEFAIDLIEAPLKSIASPIIDDLLSSDELPSSLRNYLQASKAGDNSADIIAYIAAIFAFITTLGRAYTEPAGRLITYQAEERFQTHIPDPNTIIAMEKLGSIGVNYLDSDLSRIGLTEEYKQGYRELFTKFLSLGEMGQAFHRELLDSSEITNALKRQGLDDKHIEAFFELINIIPNVQDLIRMSVREAFKDNVAREFGYDEDYDAEVTQWAQKIGLSEYWARKYWRAHWELPGVQAGFEMLHRRIIDNGKLELLLRSRDIPSFWRESLIKLSYNPYTRVDVRRMYSAGVLTEPEVYENYLDLGYDEEHAQKITQWTIDEYGPRELSLSKSDIYRFYVEGTISQDEAIEYFREKGVDEESIDLYLQRANLQKQEDYEKEFIENIRLAYIGRQIDDNDVVVRLNELNPPSGFVEERLNIWKLQRDRDTELPSKSDIKAMFVEGVISADRAVYYLRLRKNREQTIEEYIELWSKGLEL